MIKMNSRMRPPSWWTRAPAAFAEPPAACSVSTKGAPILYAVTAAHTGRDEIVDNDDIISWDNSLRLHVEGVLNVLTS